MAIPKKSLPFLSFIYICPVCDNMLRATDTQGNNIIGRKCGSIDQHGGQGAVRMRLKHNPYKCDKAASCPDYALKNRCKPGCIPKAQIEPETDPETGEPFFITNKRDLAALILEKSTGFYSAARIEALDQGGHLLSMDRSPSRVYVPRLALINDLGAE